MKTHFSIVIPSYNHSKYLPDAIKSSIEQTYENIQIIVINDGSTDNTSEVVKPFLEKITYIEVKNRGLSAARNLGIYHSKGDYIIPLDADDMISPLYCEDAAKLIETTDADVIYPDMQIFGDFSQRVPMPDLISKEQLAANNPIHHTYAVRKSVLMDCGGYNPKMTFGWEDYELNMELFERGAAFARLPSAYFMYRRHGKSMVDECNEPDKKKYLEDMLRKLHPKIYE
jgi:glycosyltransferase involved in cell wall biosynthesis